MVKSYFAMLAVAAGVAITSLAAAPANALTVNKPAVTNQSDVVQVRQGMRHGGLGIHNGGLGFRHGGIGQRRSHFRFYSGPRFYAAPVYSYRSYGDGCYHLKRKALRTGSRYWWRRYNACRWG